MALPYKRVLLKLSGEALAGNQPSGIDPNTINLIAKQIVEVHSLNVDLGIVIGGGNIVRGSTLSQQGIIERTDADYMGMLATVINCIAMQNVLESMGIITRVMSAIAMNQIAEPYIRRKALRHLEQKRIVLFGAGTGNPYFTTDSTATLRGIETNCDIILKGTKVDGIYDKDPATHDDAQKYNTLTYTDVINQQLNVMDTSSVALCRENNMPILVFNITKPNSLLQIIKGKQLGTKVTDERN